MKNFYKNILPFVLCAFILVPFVPPRPSLPVPSAPRVLAWHEKEPRDDGVSDRYNMVCFGPDWNGDGVGDFCSRVVRNP